MDLLCGTPFVTLLKTTQSNFISSYIFGEDVKFGGVFRCTDGLNQEFGSNRVFNTPLCEQGIAGFAIGLAVQDNFAIAEIQFTDYILPAFDQLVNEAAKLRYRSGNDYECGGLTVRTTSGAVGHGGHYHSQSNEAIFLNSAGIKMVVPRGPIQAKGLLRSAILDPNPIIVFETKRFYASKKDDVPVGDFELELEKAEVTRVGKDLTVISYGPQYFVAEKVINDLELEMKGLKIELIDLQMIQPIDQFTLIESVKKTGRCVITHEAPLTGSVSSELLSILQENCFDYLQAPIKRVCGMDTPFPMTLEEFYLPNEIRLREVILECLKY